MEKQCIYYDPDCMMCSWYTEAMLKPGVRSSDGRRTYADLKQAAPAGVDMERARNEIAMVDESAGRVIYGVDSFLHLFARRWPQLRGLFQSSLLRLLAYPVYKFISYNRKVISPPPVFEQEGSCTPDFHWAYRWAYLVLAGLISAALFVAFIPLVTAEDTTWSTLGMTLLLAGIGGVQAIFLTLSFGGRVMEYLGNMMTLFLIGALSMLPSIALDAVIGLPRNVALLIGVIILVFLSWQHYRRVRYLEIPDGLNITWFGLNLVLILQVL